MMWKEDLASELQHLQEGIFKKKCEVEDGVDKMEEGKKARDVKKKEILLKEMKKILAKLNEVDMQVVKDVKGEAFDYLRSMNKIDIEVAAIKETVTNAPVDDERSCRTEVNAIRTKVENLGMEEFVDCLKLSVNTQPGSMAAAFDRISDAIFLETPALSSKCFYLVIPEKLPTFKMADFNPKFIDIQLHIVSENTQATFSSVLLQKLMVTMTCVGTNRVFEECTVWSKVEKNKTAVSEDGRCISVQLQRPDNTIGKISVLLLGSNIVNSPVLHQFGQDETSSKNTAAPNLTLGNDSIGIFDMTGLDQSDINSLDITNRQKLFFPAAKHLLSNPDMQPSPAYHPPRKVSQPPNVSSVPESTASQLDDTTPFRPCSEGAVSTMRATAAASQLAGALSQLASQDVSKKEAVPAVTEYSRMNESDLSILAPSKHSAMSIDDMQRSLSGSESGAGDTSAFHPDKFVSFAPRTQVVEVLSTPQVTASSSFNRYEVTQGQTKEKDGQAGISRRLDKGENNGATDDIWDITELDTDEVVEEYNPASAATLPLVASNDLIDSASCISPFFDSCYEEDPHLMLNASKAPSPQSFWSKEDSIWDKCDEDEEDEEYLDHPHFMLNASKAPSPQSVWCKEDSIWNYCDEESDDPHLMLNASKAPPVGAGLQSVDPSWDCNASLLPDSCFEKSLLNSPPLQDNNQTVWESTIPVSKFDFLREPLEVANVYESHPIAASSTRSTRNCLISPHSITYLPKFHIFLVTEPDQDRVGIYEAETFKFLTWMEYPIQFAKTRLSYDYPTSILSLSNGFLVLLEKTRLHIFDADVKLIQSIGGVFHGLTEGPNGEIFTIGTNKLGRPVVKKLDRTLASYRWGGRILLTVVLEFENWKTLSQARFLLYSDQKIFITDEGLHKLYVVDLSTWKQVVSGYMGSKPGQFKCPTGLVADDLGNLLVGDSDNNRLVVYTGEGKFGKVVDHGDWRFSSPHDLARQGRSVLAVFKGIKEGEMGTVVRYKIAGDSGVSTPDTVSEVGV
eukprot:GFUD01018283.1.p1 GENE.GFUD01018283.1~~GFUD01018283.1.p1  ORF type:complete len:1018 (+),score=268.26 GFUD01018283.1:39-3092(+)